jgi:hypothetical protein
VSRHETVVEQEVVTSTLRQTLSKGRPREAHRTTTAGKRGTVSYVCDAISHQIHVLDGRGRWLESFGAQGRGPGQFDRPSDATLVMPMFEGEEAVESAYTALVAVADRMNHRVQIFEAAGQFVTALGGATPQETAVDISVNSPMPSDISASTPSAQDNATPAERDGWPFFRVTPDLAFNEPVRLRWRAPWLDVTEASGASHRVDLAYAMLPRFEDWLASATLHALVAAQHHLRFCIRPTPGIALPLLQLETALGDAWLRSRDIDAVARLWSLPWPAGIDAEQIRVEATRRDRLAVSTAFALGSAHRVLRVRAALRAALPGIITTHAPLAPAPDRKAVGE